MSCTTKYRRGHASRWGYCITRERWGVSVTGKYRRGHAPRWGYCIARERWGVSCTAKYRRGHGSSWRNCRYGSGGRVLRPRERWRIVGAFRRVSVAGKRGLRDCAGWCNRTDCARRGRLRSREGRYGDGPCWRIIRSGKDGRELVAGEGSRKLRSREGRRRRAAGKGRGQRRRHDRVGPGAGDRAVVAARVDELVVAERGAGLLGHVARGRQRHRDGRGRRVAEDHRAHELRERRGLCGNQPVSRVHPTILH